jgi:arylsulfatase A-like enzyme
MNEKNKHQPITSLCIGAALSLPAILTGLSLSAAGNPQPTHESASGLATPKPPPPNIIIVLADDLGYGDLACHGNPTVKTPRIDTFARQSVALASFRVSPVSSPTRASTLTGRWNFRTGVADVRPQAAEIDPAEIILAKPLKNAGYATGMFGKWHLGGVTANATNSPNALGFDEVLTFPGSALRQYFDPRLHHNGAPATFTGYCQDIFTDAAIAFIQKNNAAGKPFFIYLPYNLIHTPLQVPADLEAEHDNLGLRDTTRKIHAMVRSIDTTFGRLLDTLKTLGIENNTLVIFFSDNGPCSGSKPFDRYMAGLRGLKGTVYENGIRVPCYMRWPNGFKSPATITRPAAHIDLFPTILALASITPKNTTPGTNLTPLIRDNADSLPREGVLLEFVMDFRIAQAFYDKAWRAFRTKRYKYVTLGDYTGAVPWLFFDLQNDPCELHNLVDDPTMRDEVARHHRLLRERLVATNDHFHLRPAFDCASLP